MTILDRAAVLCAGLFGALGTAGAALAAHGGGDAGLTAIAAAIAFVHAPALLALGLAAPGRLRWPILPAGLMVVGVALFSGDLAARVLLGHRLFSNAAPVGGMILILAWASVTVLALVPDRRSAPSHGID